MLYYTKISATLYHKYGTIQPMMKAGILFCAYILTNGFIKKTIKTPENEIEKAKKYRKDYIQRKESKP